MLSVTHIFSSSAPVHTYSIVAYDESTGKLESLFKVIGFQIPVPWAKAGVGAVATQSFVKVEYGPDGLQLMENGYSAEEALNLL